MLWIKALHVIFVVTWFAGLFYVPRLFIYHSSATDSVGIQRFETMEHKLITVIMNPSAVLATILGSVLLWNAWDAFSRAWWLWGKLGLVATLCAYHLQCVRIARALAAGRRPYSDRYLRVLNELPALVLIGAVTLVIVKPGA